MVFFPYIYHVYVYMSCCFLLTPSLDITHSIIMGLQVNIYKIIRYAYEGVIHNDDNLVGSSSSCMYVNMCIHEFMCQWGFLRVAELLVDSTQ